MKRLFDHRARLWLNLIAILTAVSGSLTLNSTLFEIRHLHEARLVLADARFTVIAGISLFYLAMLLRRGKRSAWAISLGVFSLLLLRNTRHFLYDTHLDEEYLIRALLNILLPALTLAGLIIFRRLFVVKSEPTSLRIAVRRSVLVLLVAFVYGFSGFLAMDTHDFHQEISPPASAHYTVDQLGLTTDHKIKSYTRRSLFFEDSLAWVSILALAYAAMSLAAPVRFRLRHVAEDYAQASLLICKYGNNSEDFFKLWPRDKTYYFNRKRTAFLAYKVTNGIALTVGDPVGPRSQLKDLLSGFERFCALNDWQPAIIHSETRYLKLYEALGYEKQKIGQEAVIDIVRFNQTTANNKTFRHIRNKFTKLGYCCEWLSPPHNKAVLKDLKRISDSWLKRPGRAERGFMLGYYSPAYIQQCRLLVVKNGSGSLEGFINQLPMNIRNEANFDFLRHKEDSPTNINDFMMLEFIRGLGQQGYKTLNMGLAPLAGLDRAAGSAGSAISNFLNFAYTAVGRFYSFQGLARFKSKYEPVWLDRYIIYKGGLVGFGRTMNSLIKAMRV